ncbi:MAG: hypothetical protein WA137_06165 [Methanothrix sp.]
MADKEKRMATKPVISNPQATDKSEPPLRAEFVAETIRAIAELDSEMGTIYFRKKEFLDDLKRL